MCFCILLTLIFIFHIAWCFLTERYDTHLSEASQRSHIYQQQISVNSSTSIQTVIYKTNMSSSGDEVQLNGSESLSSILTRSSNGSQRQKTLSVSSAEELLFIADVAELLHPQYAIITGGRSMDTGSPLITFPDHNNFHMLTDRDYQRLTQYLIGVTSLQDADLGFQLIIDRRKNSWAQVKAVLVKISVSWFNFLNEVLAFQLSFFQSFFPGLLQCVYVLRPSGFFQKAISEVSSKFFKDEFRFKVIICAQIEELHEFIHPSQLTIDLGGSLFYSHHEWIQQRIVSYMGCEGSSFILVVVSVRKHIFVLIREVARESFKKTSSFWMFDQRNYLLMIINI